MGEAATYGDFRDTLGAAGPQYLDPGMVEAQIADKRHEHLAHVPAELSLQSPRWKLGRRRDFADRPGSRRVGFQPVDRLPQLARHLPSGH
jgi:hypothetical protein